MVRPKARIEKQQAWRETVDTRLIMKRLNNQAHDKSEMSDKAIACAKILLAKTLPDLKAVEHTGEVSVKSININF